MTVSTTPSFEQTPPHRPAESDILNGTKDNITPTVPPNFPAAEEYMQMARLLVATSRMVPLIKVQITGGGTPLAVAVVSVREDVLVGDITVVLNGTGDVSVTLPTGKFPAFLINPTACVISTSSNRTITVEQIANGARVRTKDDTGTATNTSFVVDFY